MIVAVDTAGPWVSAAAGNGESPHAARAVAARLNHNEVLAQIVRDVLRESGVERPDQLAVNVGPGSFTGTRVGVSFVVGLAQGWGVSVIEASSFQVAATLAPAGVEEVWVAVPVVGTEWCRAKLRRGGEDWSEEALEELDQEDVAADLGDLPLIVPWGDAGVGIRPPSGWNPAVALLARAATSVAAVAPAAVSVRYAGPSQAERNFHARKQSR